MSLTIAQSEDGALRLSGSLQIYDVESAAHAILAYLADHAALILDLAEITECDTAGLQLLLAARQSAVLRGKPFQLRRVSPAAFGCGAALGLPHDFLTPVPH